jgi:hypothetical protein
MSLLLLYIYNLLIGAYDMSVYIQEGYNSRRHYIKCLAEDNGLPFDTVAMLASMLGPNEDFDGLVTACEDAAMEAESALCRCGKPDNLCNC